MARAIASMMRMLAWWGTKTSRSSAVMPARSRACWPILAIVNDAQRKTGVALHREVGHDRAVAGDRRRASPPSAGSGRTARRRSPRPPGRCPGSRSVRSTAAPAPSAKMNAVPRSAHVGEVGESLDADHQRVAGAAAADHVGGQRDAVAEACAGGGDVEGRRLVGAELVGDGGGDRRGSGAGGVTVATMTQSIWLRRRCRPARSPSRAAATDIICTVSSGVAKRRCLMPERCWIHSSLESIASTTSALGTIREGR